MKKRIIFLSLLLCISIVPSFAVNAIKGRSDGNKWYLSDKADTGDYNTGGSSGGTDVTEETAEQRQNNTCYDNYNNACNNIANNFFINNNGMTHVKPQTNSSSQQYANMAMYNIPQRDLQSILASRNNWTTNNGAYLNYPASFQLNGILPNTKDTDIDKLKSVANRYNFNEGDSSNWKDYYQSINGYNGNRDLERLHQSPYKHSLFYNPSKANIKDIWNNFYNKLNGYNLKPVNTTVKDLTLYDFKNFKGRQDGLNDYLDAYKKALQANNNKASDGCSAEDSIKVVYLKQLNLTGTKHNMIYSSSPLAWRNFQNENKYFKWTITDNYNNVYPPLYSNSDEVTFTANLSGTYYAYNTKIYQLTNADVISYTYSEYLFIADTKQIIWSKVSTPSSLSNLNSTEDNPLNSRLASQTQVVKTDAVYDRRTITVNSPEISFSYSNSQTENNFILRSAADKTFDTKRIR